MRLLQVPKYSTFRASGAMEGLDSGSGQIDNTPTSVPYVLPQQHLQECWCFCANLALGVNGTLYTVPITMTNLYTSIH